MANTDRESKAVLENEITCEVFSGPQQRPQHPTSHLGNDPYEFCQADQQLMPETLAERVTAFFNLYAAAPGPLPVRHEEGQP